MGKGVISAIWEDEDMPVDDNGIRADIIMTPASIINRMNPSQLFEQYWNRTAVQVIRNMKDKYLGGYKLTEGVQKNWMEDANFKSNWRKIYAYILDFFHDFRPAYAQFVDEQLTALEKSTGNAEKMLWTEGCLNNGLYLIHSFKKMLTSEELVKVAEKYGVQATPVTYNVVDPDTGEKRTIRTKKPVLIGSKYLMLLGKIPSAALASIEVGYVSQFELPIKPKSKHVKSQAIIGQTPQKWGEDETCMMNMSVHDDKVARFFSIHSSAPEIVKELARHLIREIKPTAMIGLPLTTNDIIRKNQNVSMFNHMMSIIGYKLGEDTK